MSKSSLLVQTCAPGACWEPLPSLEPDFCLKFLKQFSQGRHILFFSIFLKSSADFILSNTFSTTPVVSLQPTFNGSPSPMLAWPHFQKLAPQPRCQCNSFHTGPTPSSQLPHHCRGSFWSPAAANTLLRYLLWSQNSYRSKSKYLLPGHNLPFQMICHRPASCDPLELNGTPAIPSNARCFSTHLASNWNATSNL